MTVSQLVDVLVAMGRPDAAVAVYDHDFDTCRVLDNVSVEQVVSLRFKPDGHDNGELHIVEHLDRWGRGNRDYERVPHPDVVLLDGPEQS